MFDLVYVVREVTSKDGKKKFNVYDFYLIAQNGHREKINPNEYKDEKGQFRSNRNVLLAYARRLSE